MVVFTLKSSSGLAYASQFLRVERTPELVSMLRCRLRIILEKKREKKIKALS